MCIGIYGWSNGKKTPEYVPSLIPPDAQTKKQPEILNLPKQITDAQDHHPIHLNDNIPRKKLCKILRDYDISILKDSNRFRGLLNDLCKGQYSREINAITTLLEEHIPQDLLISKNKIPFNVISEKYQLKLRENTYLSEELIKWSIASWALALGITNDE
jgi:hypothetical protein